jgi:hypothetical protein
MTQGESNGWNEYRRLFLEDRRENRERFQTIDEKLDQITEQLTLMRGERQTARWLAGFGIPAIVSLAVSWLAVKFGLR